MEGEELTYNVRYGFINLGQVRVKTTGRTVAAGRPVYSTIAYIDSYKKVPFVDLHAVYESTIDSIGGFSRAFQGRTQQNEYRNAAEYHFDYDHQRVLIELRNPDGTIMRRDTLPVAGPTQDGLSLFFCAREQLFAGRTVSTTAIVAEKSSTTVMNFLRERDPVEIDAVDYAVNAIHFDGSADFVGIFGLTGGFEGWFSNDDARVPILAKMKVIIGSVTIELMQWKRGGWAPPKVEE